MKNNVKSLLKKVIKGRFSVILDATLQRSDNWSLFIVYDMISAVYIAGFNKSTAVSLIDLHYFKTFEESKKFVLHYFM